jgi:hypothetical protein
MKTPQTVERRNSQVAVKDFEALSVRKSASERREQ